VPGHILDGAAELPVRQDGDKTTGIAFDQSGNRLSGGMIWSGEDGPAAVAPYLRGDDPAIPWQKLKSATSHVEGHVAALMRAPGGPRRVSLVANNPPCPGRRGCGALLPGILPAGAELDVYVSDTDGVKFFATYRGHGRGVERS
jgi:SCP1.201-like deaminase